MVCLCGVALIGWIDYITGIEMRVFPLYFLPLVTAAWYFGLSGAIVASILVTAVWTLAMYGGGRVYSHTYIWVINFLTMETAFVVVALLVAKLRQAVIREQALSRTDQLTGLANSRAFFELAEGSLSLCFRHKRPITLAYVDLDNFKRANDTMGHQHGDVLLRGVADIFRENLRSSDICARMGGDEFVVLLPETGETKARTALEKVGAQIALSPQFLTCNVTASIGAVSYPVANTTLQDMVKAADTLMYKVKASRKNYVLVETV